MSAAVSLTPYDVATTRLLAVTQAQHEPATLTPTDLGAIKGAVASVETLLRSVRPEWRESVRDDLRQELAIRLFTKKAGGEALRTVARNWMLSLLNQEKARRKTEDEYETGTGKRYRTGENWKPAWHRPHPAASQYAPFSCSGARMMLCKGTRSSVNYVEDSIIEYLDSKRRK